MQYVIIALIGYVLGSSNMALYISKIKGIDLRNGGSKNLGASNSMILMGKRAGAIVAVHDVAKAIIAVLIANLFFAEIMYASHVAGACSVLGHIFPFYLKFRGGKGFASLLGMSLALDYRFTIILIIIGVILTFTTDYIVVATMTCCITIPLYFFYMTQDIYALLILCIPSLVIIYKHRENFIRLKNGEEIGLRKANKHSKEA